MFSYYQKPKMNVQEMIAAEKLLSKQERRERYRCRSKYITLDKITPWFVDLVAFEKIQQNPPIQTLRDADINMNRKISHYTGNICTLEIDAIVNAANESMLGGGGIDGAIHSAAGDNLYLECKSVPKDPETGDRCNCGESKITLGYNLPAKFVIHTVGPRGEKPTLLKNCYNSVLTLAKEKKIRSVALCGISTGIFGYPLENASRIACESVREWLEDESNRNSIDRIIFVTFLDKERICYNRLLQEYFPYVEDAEYNEKWKTNPGSFIEREEEKEDQPNVNNTNNNNDNGENNVVDNVTDQLANLTINKGESPSQEERTEEKTEEKKEDK